MTFNFLCEKSLEYLFLRDDGTGLSKKLNKPLYRLLFFRKYDPFFSLPKKCAKNYPEKDFLKLGSV